MQRTTNLDLSFKENLCSLAWSKEPKIKAVGLYLKRKLSIFLIFLASMRFILFTPELLILSVICCAASSKSLTFQFVHKTQQSQGQKGDSELGEMICKWNRFVVIFLDDLFWNQFSVLLLDQKNEKSRLRDCC